MKILHTSDIHLRSLGDERWQTLERLIELAKQSKVELFVISGDLFDSGINAEELRTHIRGMLSHTGFKICLIPGNHDANSYKEGAYFGEDVVVINDFETPFIYKDVTIWGFPYQQGNDVLYKIRSLTNRLTSGTKHILLYHGDLLDVFISPKDAGEEGDQRYMPVRLSYFDETKIDYVLAGHFHRRFDFWQLKSGGYFVYCGSPVSITRREVGQRHANLFELGRPPKAYPLETFYYEEVDINLDPFSGCDPLEVVNSQLQKINKNASIMLKLKGFIDGKALGLNETQFVNKIKKTLEGYRAELLENEVRDIGAILGDDFLNDFWLNWKRWTMMKKRWVR